MRVRVRSCGVSPDGLHVCVGTEGGAIGSLHIPSQVRTHGGCCCLVARPCGTSTRSHAGMLACLPQPLVPRRPPPFPPGVPQHRGMPSTCACQRTSHHPFLRPGRAKRCRAHAHPGVL
eukprot:365590-Chlamydomonas_euryale.AAC.7